MSVAVSGNEVDDKSRSVDKQIGSKSKTLGQSKRKANPKQFECSICSKTFTRLQALNDHKNIHNNIRPLQCPDCGKSFRQSSNLYRHKQLHQETKRFACLICGRSFRRHSYLKSHLISHEEEKTRMCHECGSTFKYHCDLTRHLKIHENKRQYKCDVCQVGFNDRSSMRRHERMVHAEKKCPESCVQQVHCEAAESSTETSCQVTSSKSQTPQDKTSNNLADPIYLNWLIDYVSVCRILPQPLPSNMFLKVVDLHKDVAIYLDSQSTSLNQVLKNVFDDLHTVISEHLIAKKS